LEIKRKISSLLIRSRKLSYAAVRFTTILKLREKNLEEMMLLFSEQNLSAHSHSKKSSANLRITRMLR